MHLNKRFRWFSDVYIGAYPVSCLKLKLADGACSYMKLNYYIGIVFLYIHANSFPSSKFEQLFALPPGL